MKLMQPRARLQRVPTSKTLLDKAVTRQGDVLTCNGVVLQTKSHVLNKEGAMTFSHTAIYQSPTIQEALCEVSFRPQNDHPWTALTPLKFYQTIQSDFPNVEEVPNSVLQIKIGADEAASSAVPKFSTLLRFRHASRPLMLQLSENRIIVNCLGNYQGWVRMREDIQYAWQKISAVSHPSVVTRIGLRYINRIEREFERQTLGEWLTPTEYVPRAALSSLPGFTSQLHVRVDATNRISVILGEPETAKNLLPPFIFDIDRISEEEMSSEGDLLLERIDAMHQEIRNIFFNAKGAKLEKLLRGEL